MLRRILKRSSTIVYNKIRFYSLEAYQDHLLDQSLQQKILKVAVIGTPNSGKSTFINYLMDRKVNYKRIIVNSLSDQLLFCRSVQLLVKCTPLEQDRKQFLHTKIVKLSF